VTIAVACIVAGIAGLALDPRRTAAAFLVAYVAALSVVLGTMAMLMIAQITTATWFASFERLARRVVGSAPVLAVFGVIPVAVSLWAGPPAQAGSARALYMAGWFVVLRAILYWVSWLAIGWGLRSPRPSPRLAAGGLVVLAITMTFASFDWMMSLSADWYSTIYGVYWFAGGMIGALGLLAVLARAAGVVAVSRDRWLALGSLLLTFVLFWAYAGFAQYVVIWSGDIPREVTWYVARARGAWGGVALAILFGAGVIPFLILLLGRTRRSGGALGALGGALLAFHYFDSYWLVMPNLAPVGWLTILLSGICLGAVVVPATLVAVRST
jgi:hypothetical protein